jgi:hypothetical protein
MGSKSSTQNSLGDKEEEGFYLEGWEIVSSKNYEKKIQK